MYAATLSALFILCLVVPTSAQESIPFATDGKVTHSTLPLDHFREYFVTLKSPYDLRGISSLLGYRLSFDGTPFNERSTPLVTSWNTHHAMRTLRFRYIGTGKPLGLRLTTDLSQSIPGAFLEIEPVPIYRHRTVESAAIVIVGIIVIGGGVLLFGYVTDRGSHQTPKEQQASAEAQRKRDYEWVPVTAQIWKVNAEAHKNFCKPEFCENYAKTKMEEVLKNPNDYLDEYQRILKDTTIHNYLKQYLPDTLAAFQGRAETFHIAQRLNTQRKTPEEYQQDQLRWAEIQQERKIRVTVSAFTQYIEKKARLRQEADELITKHPHLKQEIEDAYKAFEPPNPNKEPTDVAPAPQPPEPEYF